LGGLPIRSKTSRKPGEKNDLEGRRGCGARKRKEEAVVIWVLGGIIKPRTGAGEIKEEEALPHAGEGEKEVIVGKRLN